MLENTKENKAKFFAQYYGQKVWCCELHNELMNVDYEVLCHVDESLMGAPIIKEWLELTQLSQVTDKDAIEVAKMFGMLEDEIFVGKWLVMGMFDNSADCVENKLYNANAEVVDYLRSKSYLLPFNNTSIEKIIEYGWVVIKN